ncbi:Gfo/Idh/MocA family protein [Sphingomonas horti]|uniref:Gfo/Idh/MocA family protein n=1 Tax=Sphingomonas horti TaxID=2682842 RepID=UPI0018559EFF|nr:Gfo/Idh/MocA family oxidoreductase [Sphingomonas horti]MBA2919773.1 Gfo/Idh/MocA family oxidoreductase [Sphingomonas sp. CGMCC 1.13658]
MKIGIIGSGRMGITHHSIINTHPDVRVVATADPSMVINKLLAKYAGVRTHRTYEALLREGGLDAVLLCTPPAANHAILTAVRQHGLHAFVEKPFVLSATQGRELAASFSGAGLVNQVGYVNRFNDVFFQLRTLVSEGVFGRVHQFRSEMYSPTIVRQQKGEGWRASHANGGGAIYEMASHAIDLINFLFGKPDLVKGSSLTRVFSENVEDIVTSTFLYKTGLSGLLYTNWSDASYRKPANRIEVYGERGKAIADQHGLKIHLPEANEAHGLAAGWNQRSITDLSTPVPFYLRGNEFTRQLYDFVDAIRMNRNTRCTFSDAAATLEIVEAIFADWQNNKSELVA